MSRTYLKIKVTSLAAEQALIRREEQKVKKAYQRKRKSGDTPPSVFFGLQEHRKKDVRPEARAANLAYGFLRGRTYAQMEPKTYETFNFKRVEALVLKYGGASMKPLFVTWLKAAAEHLATQEHLRWEGRRAELEAHTRQLSKAA